MKSQVSRSQGILLIICAFAVAQPTLARADDEDRPSVADVAVPGAVAGVAAGANVYSRVQVKKAKAEFAQVVEDGAAKESAKAKEALAPFISKVESSRAAKDAQTSLLSIERVAATSEHMSAQAQLKVVDSLMTGTAVEKGLAKVAAKAVLSENDYKAVIAAEAELRKIQEGTMTRVGELVKTNRNHKWAGRGTFVVAAGAGFLAVWQGAKRMLSATPESSPLLTEPAASAASSAQAGEGR